MTQTLTVNTARSNLYTSLVASVPQPYTPKQFPKLVFGETIDVELYLTDAARSGVAGFTPRIVITLADQKPSGGTFTISDGIDTTAALDWDSTETEIETALNALNSNTGPDGDTVTVDKYSNGSFNVFFDTVGDRATLTVAASGVQPVSTASILPIVEGDATTREQQLIQIKASPLVFSEGGTLITDGWRMTLDTNNANFLQATAREAISANYSIEIVNASSEVDVIARGPVILEPATFNVAALNGIAYPDIPQTTNGWAIYYDSQYTIDDQLSIAAETRTMVTIDALGSLTNKTQIPNGVSDFWDASINKVTPVNVGDSYDLRLDFVADPQSNTESVLVELDIGDGNPSVVIVALNATFPEQQPQEVSVSFPFFSLETFINNGGSIYITPSSNFTFYNFSIFIKRDYTAS